MRAQAPWTPRSGATDLPAHRQMVHSSRCSSRTAGSLKAQAAIEWSSATTARVLRGQAAIEVLAYASFFFLVFVSAASTFAYLQAQELARAENAYAQEVAYSIADQVKTAFIAGDGFSQSVQVPRAILGKPYVIGISAAADASAQETGFAYVYWQGQGGEQSFSAPTITAGYGAVESPGFIWEDHGTGMIMINASQGFPLNMTNSGGKITFGKGWA